MASAVAPHVRVAMQTMHWARAKGCRHGAMGSGLGVDTEASPAWAGAVLIPHARRAAGRSHHMAALGITERRRARLLTRLIRRRQRASAWGGVGGRACKARSMCALVAGIWHMLAQ